jgi:ribosomal RNA-processing protein 12
LLNLISPKKEKLLLPDLIAVIVAGFKTYVDIDPDLCIQRLPTAIGRIFPLLESDSETIRELVGSSLVSLVNDCIPASTVKTAKVETLEEISDFAARGLSTRYHSAWRQVFLFVAALLIRLGDRANLILHDTVGDIEKLRADPNFEGRKEAEVVLGAAIKAVGPEVFLELLPLNLEFSRYENTQLYLPCNS